MKLLVSMALVSGLAAMALAAPAGQQAAPSSQISELYRTLCQQCHGENGVAKEAPEMSFVGRKWKHGTSVQAMAKVITDGVPGSPMMPFKDKLTAAQITSLARYVRAFDKTLKRERDGH